MEGSEFCQRGARVTINTIACLYHGQRGTVETWSRSSLLGDRDRLSFLVKLDGRATPMWFGGGELCSNEEESARLKAKLQESIDQEPVVLPLTIAIFLAIYVSPREANESGVGYVPSKVWHSPAAVSVRNWLTRHELINEAGADITAKGRAWLDALLTTPLPVKEERWRVPTRAEIKNRQVKE